MFESTWPSRHMVGHQLRRPRPALRGKRGGEARVPARAREATERGARPLASLQTLALIQRPDRRVRSGGDWRQA